MFRRHRTAPTTTEGESRRAARHSRRARDEQNADAAALQVRLERAQRRLAQVGCVVGPVRPEAIDNASARRDPMTRPFPVVFGGAPSPRRERSARTGALAGSGVVVGSGTAVGSDVTAGTRPAARSRPVVRSRVTADRWAAAAR